MAQVMVSKAVSTVKLAVSVTIHLFCESIDLLSVLRLCMFLFCLEYVDVKEEQISNEEIQRKSANEEREEGTKEVKEVEHTMQSAFVENHANVNVLSEIPLTLLKSEEDSGEIIR